MMEHCATCRFWHRDKDDISGDCWLFGDDSTWTRDRPPIENEPKKLAWTQPFAGSDGAGFSTMDTFGCVQHEPCK